MGIWNWLVGNPAPAEALAYLKKGIKLEKQNNFFEAYQTLLEAVTIQGLQNPWLYNNLAWYAWAMIKEGDELSSGLALFALHYFNRALELEPRNELFKNNRYEFVQYCFDSGISLRKTGETLAIPYDFEEEETWSLSEFVQDLVWNSFQGLVFFRNYYRDNKAWCWVSTVGFVLVIGVGYFMTGFLKSLV